MDHFLLNWGWSIFYVCVFGAGWWFIHLLFSGKLWDDEYDENGYTRKK